MANMQNINLPIKIVADDRERKSDVIESLLEIENVEVDIQRLSIGDYQIGNRVIVREKDFKRFCNIDSRRQAV